MIEQTPFTQRPMVWRLGSLQLDERQRELRIDGQLRAIEPKPMAALLTLLRNANQLVTKDVLITDVWDGRAVGDTAIARCMAKLRTAVGPELAESIRTVHGYGYRLTVAADAITVSDVALAATPALSALMPGAPVPGCQDWTLERPLSNGRIATWLAVATSPVGDTAERRVFRFATDAVGCAELKREVAVHACLRERGYALRAPVPAVLDSNFEQEPTYIACEYLARGSLAELPADWLRVRAQASPNPLALAVAIRLAQLHAAGLAHGALAPWNILLRDGDAVDVAFIGITDVVPSQPELLIYRAPELGAGAASTRSADCHAFGVLLYQFAMADLGKALGPGWERGIDDPVLCADIAAAAEIDPARRLVDAAELVFRLRHVEGRRRHLADQAEHAARLAALRTEERRSRGQRRLRLAVGLALGAGIAISSGLLLKAHEARRAAEEQLAISEEFSRFITSDLLGAANPYTPGGGRTVTISSVLDSAAASLEKRFANRPKADLQLASAIGGAYRNLGVFDAADTVLRNALARAEPRLGAMADPVRAIKFELAALQFAQAQPLRARDIYRELMAHAESKLGASHPETLAARKGLTWIRYEAGYFAEAEREAEQLRDDIAAALSADHPLFWDLQADLVEMHCETHRWSDAEQLVDRVIARFETSHGLNSPRRFWPMLSKVYLLHMQERWAEAESLVSRVRAEAMLALGADHPVALATDLHLGSMRLRQNRYAEAMGYFERALARHDAVFGRENYRTRRVMNRIGAAATFLGRTDEALAILGDALQRSSAALGPDHPHTLDIARLLAEAELAAGRLDAAEGRFRRVLALGPNRMPPNNNRIAWTHWGLGRLLSQAGRMPEAKIEFRAAHALFKQNFGDGYSLTRRSAEQAGDGASAVSTDAANPPDLRLDGNGTTS